MITPTIKRELRGAYRKVSPHPTTPETMEQEAIRVIASLDTSDVLKLAQPFNSGQLSQLIQEIIR